ncbi:hypothetical protein [Stenoxybacter acetivorans]|uniref:hypothetical protein n=1 Tax=Stenoxybacter acetivorans TaxID=422441 RepID=UPI000561A8AA|nr:hypothetical protein [Stenoxybacter acetivorans]
MQIALHPYKDEIIDTKKYRDEFGNNANLRPLARCRFCKQLMFLRAGNTLRTQEHFAHKKNSGMCPSKVMDKRPYLGLQPSKSDLTHAHELKRQFLINWQKHYTFMRQLIKNMSPYEFGDLLKRSEKLRIWEYIDLQEHEIPYILCTLADFPPQKKTERNLRHGRFQWVRCWFNTVAEKFDDLWINGEKPVDYWVASYSLPEGSKQVPNQKYLNTALLFPINEDFLHQLPNLATGTIIEAEKQLHQYLG